MSIKIHHGPPGSYKTSGAVADDFIPAVLAGRHIITNVRGLESESNVRGVLEGKGMSVPESFRLTFIDSGDSEQMEMLRRFWHWSPDGAFFLIDEVQEVWSKSLRDSHLAKLNYPNGIDQANQDGKFLTIALAFEKHRHRNWDFIVTSPNINKVHPVVRGSAEAAYKHKNLATLGKLFKGRYIEAYHAADTNGKPADFYSIRRKSIPKYVFSLYKSTATGVVTDTTAGQSLFKDPKVLGLLIFIALIFLAVFSLGAPKMLSGEDSPQNSVPSAAPAPITSNVGAKVPVPPAGTGVSNVVASTPVEVPPRLKFVQQAESIKISSSYTMDNIRRYYLRFALPNNQYVTVTEETSSKLGLVVSILDDCMYEVRAGQYTTFAFCEEEPLPVDSSTTAQLAPVALQGASDAATSLTQ